MLKGLNLNTLALFKKPLVNNVQLLHTEKRNQSYINWCMAYNHLQIGLFTNLIPAMYVYSFFISVGLNVL